MVILALLKGGVVFLSAAALVVLIAGVIEERVQRNVGRASDAVFAIGILRRLVWAGIPVCAFMTLNYIYRFDSGLPGSLLPGPQSNSVLSLMALAITYSFFIALGVSLFFLLRESEQPTEQEMARRRREARTRALAEERSKERRRSARDRAGERASEQEGGR